MESTGAGEKERREEQRVVKQVKSRDLEASSLSFGTEKVSRPEKHKPDDDESNATSSFLTSTLLSLSSCTVPHHIFPFPAA